MSEQWKDVPGYEGRYQVSNLGNVRSVDRLAFNNRWGQHATRKMKGKTLKQSVSSVGYLVVGFRGIHNTDKKEVHSLVSAAFLGPRPKGYFTHHKDENKLNNHIDNLEYISHSAHSIHHNQGEGGAFAKLTESQVKEIRQRLQEGYTQVELAKQYGVAQAHISTIKLRKAWKHI